MKKLMTALAVCAVAGFALATGGGVVSANIVGYVNQPVVGQYFSSGNMFITVGSTNQTWRLGDVTVTGMNPQEDIIQFLSPANANTILYATYIDAATAVGVLGDPTWQGWWDPTSSFAVRLDDTMIAAGTGFLCNIVNTNVSFTYAGQVLQGSTTLNLSGLQYPMIANFTPVDLVLSNLTVSGMNPQEDIIQFLNPADANTMLYATYIDAATAVGVLGDPTWQGWWDPTSSFAVRLDSQPFPKGTAFLGNLASPNVMITFPNPVQ